MNTEESLPDRVQNVLADAGTWAEPPAGMFRRVMTEARRPKERMHSVWIAAALALVLVGLVLVMERADGSGEGVIIAMNGTPLAPQAVGTAQLREAASGWYIRLEIKGLPPAPEDKYYQGWLWGGDQGVSIGTFHMRNGPEPVALWSGVSPEGFPVVKVTLQDVGGESSPSDRVMMEGLVSEPVG